MSKLSGFVIVFTGLLGLSSVAMGGTVSCPGTVITTDREFSLTTNPSAICLASGTGNISGNADAINALGYVTLDKSDDATSGLFNGALSITGSGTTSGTFSITPPTGFFNFVLGLKAGEGVLNPDWAAFLLPNGVLTGLWSISGDQGLSHANLYGQPCPGGVCPPREIAPVPLPVPFVLLAVALSGLGAGGWLAKRRAGAFPAMNARAA